MRILIAGWFSFENAHATGGDLLVCDLVRQWLATAGHWCDVALAAPFQGGVELERVDPSVYSHVVFVCGPFMQREWEARFLGRFAHCVVVGVNLTLPVPVELWNPFDFLVERDSSRDAHPDLTFLSAHTRVPVTGVCLLEPHEGGLVDVANAAVERLIAARPMAVVRIDTRLDINSTGLRTPEEIETLLSRMDLVVTTRLHGTVLALKHGVPALVIDTVPGTAKVTRQAWTIGWPVVFSAETLDDSAIQQAFDYCLSDAARAKARECATRATVLLEEIRRTFVPTIESLQPSHLKRAERVAFARAKGWVHDH